MQTLFSRLALIAIFLSGQSVYAEEQSVCRFGIPPWQKGQSFNEARKTYKPMLRWLSDKTGCRFLPVSAKSYADMIDKLANGVVHIAEISPVPYVLAKQKNPEVDILVTALSWNPSKTKQVDSYRGHIIAHKNNIAIKTPEDLKGKVFGFVRKTSSSGFVYPNALLQEMGIDYQTDFKEHLFLGSHPSVTDAIANHSIGAGATWDHNLDQATAKHGEVFNIVFTSPPIPNVGIATHPSLSPTIRAKLAELLPTIPPRYLKDMPAEAYVVRPDSFYDAARKVAASKTAE